MFRKPCALAAMSLLLVTSFALGDDTLWQSDFEAAKAQAAKEKKPILVNFTGSDWCIYCKLLGKEVFDTNEFKKEAPKQFVLVELDYPHSKELSKEIKEQNAKLRKTYQVSGFPTVLVVDPKGELIARTGYRKGSSPEKYIKTLGEFVSIHEELGGLRDKLASLKGIDRAKLLDRIIAGSETLGRETEELASFSKEIQELDGDNQAGLKSKHEFRSTMVDAKQLKKERKFKETIALLEKARTLPGVTPEQIQESYYALEGECRFYLKDYVGLVACLKKAVEAAPESTKVENIQAMLKRFAPMGEAQETLAKVPDELEKAKGLERAKLLDRLIVAQTTMLSRPKANPKDLEKISAWKKEILSVDAENEAGFKTKYELFPTQMTEARTHLKAKEFEKAHAALDDALKLPGVTPTLSQEANLWKGQCYAAQKEPNKALDAFKKALSDAPESPQAPLLERLIESTKKSLASGM